MKRKAPYLLQAGHVLLVPGDPALQLYHPGGGRESTLGTLGMLGESHMRPARQPLCD